jgi:tol-pal system protein YbgF
MGESRDPLLGQGGGAVQLGTLNQSEAADIGKGRPLNLSLDAGAQVSTGDARAQFDAGYDAVMRGDYAFAEDQFRQFVALYPDDPQASDAANWLGEALLQQGSYDEAADALMDGFEKYRDTPRGPDLLLKLGVALAGAGETETACRTFFEVGRRYPNVSPAFASRLSEERAHAKCPA